MKVGTVIRDIKLEKQTKGLEQERIILVDIDGNDIAALDKTGAETGDRVLLVMSHAAGRYSMEAPTDAVVIAVVAP